MNIIIAFHKKLTAIYIIDHLLYMNSGKIKINYYYKSTISSK